MANVRIDNFTDDTVSVFINGQEYRLEDEERTTVAVEKGVLEIRVHRSRIPMETDDLHDVDRSDIVGNTERNERSMHTQLDGIFKININSAKAIITIKTKVKAKEKFGIDALFSGYGVEVSGARVEEEKLVFASKRVQKRFIRHQFKEAMIPVGFGSIFLLILGAIAIYANIIGKAVNIGGREFTYPWSIGLLAVGLGFAGYATFVIIHSIKISKQYKE